MILQNFSVDGLRFEYGKLQYDQYNLLFIVEGVTHDSEFVRLSKTKVELDLYGSKALDKETWQDKPKQDKPKVATLTPIEPIASAAQALASATPAVSAMSDTAPIKRGRGRPRKVVQQ